MNARKELECLLEQGFISQEEFNALAAITTITGDLRLAMEIRAMNLAQASAIYCDDVDDIDDTTAKPALNPEEAAGFTKAVVTAHNNDVNFTVVASESPLADTHASGGFGHTLKMGINYTFTPQEIKDMKLIAANADAEAHVTFTFYK